MTSTLPHGAARGQRERVHPPLRALTASPALILLLLGGLALRLTIAYVLFPSSGFESDISSYASWALTLGEHGPGGFYAATSFSDYPPAYLYLLWPIGIVASGTADPVAAASALVKIPPILLDVAVGYAIYRLVLGWAHPGRRAEGLALLAAALFVLNPVTMYDSALWGQTDAAGALVIVLGVAALVRGNSEGAAALAVVAALVKPQFGVVLIPLTAAMLLKRHLARPGSGPRHRPWAPPGVAAWLARTQGWPRLLTSLVAALVAFAVLALPFGMGPFDYVERMFGTAAGYAWLSVNAFNAWALVGSGDTPPLAQALAWSDDTIPFWGPLPAVVIGAVLLAAGYLWGVIRAAARDDRWTLLAAATFLAIAFFILPTRVHERYVFPAVALMPILAVGQARWAVALALLSLGAFINLHGILTIPLYGTDSVSSLPLGEWFRSAPLIALSAALQTGVGLWAAWQLRPTLRTSPDAFDAVAAEPATPPTATAAHVPASVEPEAWVRGPSALDWVIARLSRAPLRRDRSDELAAERGGRLDRVDALALVVIVVLAVTLRGFRLDQPVSMYFDEVYHARTATEFLQHWEYGLRHDIYEYTHPHLAKYAMAWGIRLFGGNEVSSVTQLGATVSDATLERRWAPTESSRQRNGDRLYVATGVELRAYDLATRDLVVAMPAEAVAVAIDEAEHRLYLADHRGAISVLDTTALDAPGATGGSPPLPMALGVGPGSPVDGLVASDVSLVAVSAASLSTFDKLTGAPYGERRVSGVAEVVPLPAADRVVADASAVDDRGAVARRLADILGDDADRIEGLLETDHGSVVIAAYPDDEARTALSEGIEDGTLAGIRLEVGSLLAVAGTDGVAIMDARTLDIVDEVGTLAPVAALALVEGLADPTLYAAAGSELAIISLDEDGARLTTTLGMPGAVRDVAWNEPANLVHVLGEAPAGGPTVYVVEPHGNAVFIDVPLPEDPVLLLADTQPDRPADDRTQLLALGPAGGLTNIEIGQNAFGWRLPGVILGALTAGLLYLLARVLFARRSVALFTAALVIAEGMLFANSRIAMNDVYVTTLIVLAVLLFAPLYLARPRPWAAAGMLLGAGLALGLALASKWVALYAVGGIVLLVLLRSGLGRIIALVGMVGLTAVLGAMAIQAAPTDDPNRNWAFLLLMVLLTGLLAAGIVRRPLPVTRGELALAVLAPVVVGIGLVALGTLLATATGTWLDEAGLSVRRGGPLSPSRLALAGGLLALVGLGSLLVAWLAARIGHGPLAGARASGAHGPGVDADASTVEASAAATSGWLLPGWRGGLPWLFTLAVLTVVPVGVYIVSYAPWVELGNQWGIPLVGDLPFLPAGAEAGQTLADLTRSMYEYHDNLRAEHAASSPWWAWPLDLKPVWFYQDGFAGPTTGLIYDAGNLVVFWMGIPAMAFAAWMAWRRRSSALAIVVVMWAALWLPWARIDRATFQYHVYASLPFVVLALAYLLAELWHGPSPRTWFLARAAAALAILAVPLLWLVRVPLCVLAGTAVAHPEGLACAAEVTRSAQLSEGGTAALLVLATGAGLAAFLGRQASVVERGYPGVEGSRRGVWLAGLVLVALATLVGVVLALLVLDTVGTTTLTLTSDILALLALVVLAIPAWLVVRARDARRLALGIVVAALLWLLLWYPNLSGLPLPSEFASLYQGLLPTWNYDFQFAVNTDPPVQGQPLAGSIVVVGAVTTLFVLGVGVLARVWGRASGHGRSAAYASLPETPRG